MEPRKNRTNTVLTLTAGIGSVTALSLGTLVLGAAPAQAAAPPVAPDQPACTLHEPHLHGVDAPASTWKSHHGSAPVPFNGGAAAGGPGPELTQKAPGSSEFTLRSTLHDAVGLQDGADPGTYDVTMGDGTCAESHEVKVGKDGKLDLSEFHNMGVVHGQTMVQVYGPLNEDAQSNGTGKYLSRDGKGTDTPMNATGAVVYAADSAVVPVDISINEARNAQTGLPVVDAGTESIPLQVSGGMGLPSKADTPVDATYRDSESGDVVTIKDVGEIKSGRTEISGGEISQLPSGRYDLSFTDGSGNRQNVFVLVGDNEYVGKQGSLYDGLS